MLAIEPSFGIDADGGAGPGGGDRCENRFKLIAQDLSGWIKAGGPAGLQLKGISTSDYSAKILEQIQKARITCVGSGDAEFPVLVYGKAKECKNFVDVKGISRIVCDRQKFYSGLLDPENDSTQYLIVHHEYASLAGLEKPDIDNSNYEISNQITAYLEEQLVNKLVVNPHSSKLNLMNKHGILFGVDGEANSMNQKDALKACPAKTHLPTFRELIELAQMHGARGILETGEYAKGERPKGYEKVSVTDLDGKKDEFFYSLKGMSEMNGLWRNTFWSSSSGSVQFSENARFVLDFGMGQIGYYDTGTEVDLHVLCLPNDTSFNLVRSLLPPNTDVAEFRTDVRAGATYKEALQHVQKNFLLLPTGMIVIGEGNPTYQNSTSENPCAPPWKNNANSTEPKCAAVRGDRTLLFYAKQPNGAYKLSSLNQQIVLANPEHGLVNKTDVRIKGFSVIENDVIELTLSKGSRNGISTYRMKVIDGELYLLSQVFNWHAGAHAQNQEKYKKEVNYLLGRVTETTVFKHDKKAPQVVSHASPAKAQRVTDYRSEPGTRPEWAPEEVKEKTWGDYGIFRFEMDRGWEG